MPVWIFLVFAVWPVIGLLFLSYVNVRRRVRGKPGLPPATRPGEILARMYLWPIVYWRIRRTEVGEEGPGEGGHPGEDN